MILDIHQFIEEEAPYWRKLEKQLDFLAQRTGHSLSMAEIQDLYYLYRRAGSDLTRLTTFSVQEETREHLENLVARAYGEIHESREIQRRFRPLHWFFGEFPGVFRKHVGAFHLALLATLFGSLLGAGIVAFDVEAKAQILPFSHLMGDPSERVEEEESRKEDRLEGAKSQFAAMLMTNNIRVSIFAMALGISFGIGTIIILFYNGVILGAVVLDYILAGESVFLAGWLLPHGSVEIPAILLAGQAGLVLGKALIGGEGKDGFRARLRSITPDIITLIAGVALLLIWAGIIESFFSQYHEPALPYALKIAFGSIQLFGLFLFLSLSGKRGQKLQKKEA